MATNKITYGLRNVCVWAITATDDDGKPTYGTKIDLKGAVSLSLDAEGSNDPFYADDNIYWQGVANNGYSGSVTIADVPEEFRTTIMKEIVDKGGAIFEDADAQPSEFAMAFEFQGDAQARRHVFYRCLATRPSVASSTKEDSITPNTNELSLTCRPRLDNGYTKASCEADDSCYSSWFGTAPYEYAAS